MTDQQSDVDAEEALQAAKEQKRHTSQATSVEEDQDVAVDRVTAIKDALLAIENGESPENINFRDAQLKALLVGLDDVDELGEAAQRISTVLDDDVNTEDAVSQSDLARLLIRVGLREALPEVRKDATEAEQQKALEQTGGY
ncbi:hypothetical protein PNP59_10910 [Halobacterium salinarum]|uniref:hypothetical protein n=1 Tax=Halobacterium TaxID=2239 RepID=UPI00255484C0|nr:hypothetical protein [Halobacterium salinarum]MDL0131438.1 hypothetical protein [Halobacterium salinarum]MDL0145886.1 hypothetical protein [Halobacterium salinarum]